MDRIIRIKLEAGNAEKQIDSIDSSMRSAGASADALNAELLGLSTSTLPKLTPVAQGVSRAVQQTNSSMSQLRNTAGNLGFQLQDIAVQAQAGASAFVILGQQGSQIASAFGPTGAVVGAIIAVGAAIASVFAPSLLESETAVDRLDTALERLSNTVLITDSGISVLTEEIRRLAQQSDVAARLKIASALIDTRDAAREAAAGIREAFDISGLDFAIQQLEDGAASLVGFIPATRRAFRELGEQFGATGEAALTLGLEIGGLIAQAQKVPSVENFAALQNRLSELALNGKTGNAELVKLVGNLSEFFSKARTAAESAEFLTNAQKNLNDVLQTGTETSATLLDELNQKLAVTRTELNQGELAATLLATAFSLGLETANDLPPAIRSVITELFNLEQQAKAAEEQIKRIAQSEQELSEFFDALNGDSSSGQSEEATARINQRIAALKLETQTLGSELTLQQGIRQGFISQEQAQLDLQTASKIQKAISERDLLLAEKTITDQQILEAEDAFQAQMAAIALSYAEQKQQADLDALATQAQYAQQLQDIQLGAASAALNGIASFAKQGSGLQKALFIALKGIQAAQAYTSGLTAAMLARATIPYPFSEPIALAQITAGKVSAAAILATGVAGAIGGGGGRVSAGGGSTSISSSPATLPTTPQSAPNVQTLEIVGLDEIRDELRNQDGMVSTRFVATILDKISDANRIRGEG